MQNKKNLTGTAVLMGVMILAAKVCGLLRDMLITQAYGTGTSAAIAYETASKLPVTLFDLVIGGVVTAAFVPVFNELLVRDGREKALAFAQSYTRFILLVTTALAVVGVAFASPLVTLMAPGLDEATHTLATHLTRILFPMIVFTGLAFTFVGYLQSMGEFRVPAVISLVANAIMVAYLLTLNRFFGIVGLACAMLLGWTAQALVQIPSLCRLGYRYRPFAPLSTPELKKAIVTTVPILIGTWVSPVCNLINTRLASAIDGGRGLTVLGYANRLYVILVGLFSFVATNLIFPILSRAAASGDTAESARLTRQSIKTLCFLIVPLTAGVFLLAEPFVALLYERGAFTHADTILTAEALRFYTLAMTASAINEVLTKSFFAAQKPKLPMLSALCAMVVNGGAIFLFGGAILDSAYPVAWIASISGIAVVVNMAVNLAFTKKIGGLAVTHADLLDLAKTVLAAAAMSVVVCLVSGRFSGNLARFAIGTLSGIVVYVLCTVLLRSETVGVVLRRRK